MESLLVIEPGLFLWTVITFVILLLILWKAAWKPIVDALDDRAEKVRDDIERAETNRVESEKLLTEHRELLKQAKDTAEKIVSDSKTTAEKVKSEILLKTTEESRELLERAKKEIEVSKERALTEMKSEIVNISTDIAAKIIMKNLKPEDNANLVKETLNTLAAKEIVQ